MKFAVPGVKRKRTYSDCEDEDMVDGEDIDDVRHGSNDDYRGSDDSDDIVPWKSKIKVCLCL